MGENSKGNHRRKWLWHLFVLFSAIGILGAIAASFFRWTGDGKQRYIIDNLRFIDGAKTEWAIEHIHGVTTADQALQLTNQPTEQDLIPYVGKGYLVHPIAGEIYTINPMNLPPVTKLTRKVGTWPKGAVFWLPYNLNLAGELILTNQAN